MPRSIVAAALFVSALAAASFAQPSSQRFPGSDPCAGRWNAYRAAYCESRQEIIGGDGPLDVDAGRNGGIRVHGSDRGDVQVRTSIAGYADTEDEARRLVSGVRVETGGGRIRAEGPDSTSTAHWSVSFELEVPRTVQLTLNTRNGGISIDDYRGTAEFHARNGGVSLSKVGGDIRGETRNGGLRIELEGNRWDGAGLDVSTHNGGVQMWIPGSYSAELEAGTTNGGVSVDFPIRVQGELGRRITTILGSGGAKLRAITTNGGVAIRRR